MSLVEELHQTACDACLERSRLVGELAAPIDERVRPGPAARAVGLLGLPDDELVAAAGVGAARGAPRASLTTLPETQPPGLPPGLGSGCSHSGVYPAALNALRDPPAAVHFTGPAERFARLVQEPAVTVVGARSASQYGLDVAYELGRGLAAAGVVLVSGMALGIDAAAHRGALDAGGPAIAVLASGPDVAYPRRHRRLHERLIAHGTVLSEMPPGTGAFRWAFPARNRLMAALGRLTVVVEAAASSGSLTTVDFANLANREVGAVPGRVNARVSEGSNALLHDGAHVIRGPQDVLDLLFGAGTVASAAPADQMDDLPDDLRAVLDAIEAGEPPEAVTARAGLEARELRRALAQLELRGLVERAGVGGWRRAP